VTNAATFFTIAYLHNADVLKQLAIKFIVDNYDQVKATPEMALIATSHPKALLDILDFSAKSAKR
jgi:hypothetical protein